MENSEGILDKKLDAAKAKEMDIKLIKMDEKTFRWMMNEDAMATEIMAEGIRNFTKDLVKLEKHLAAMSDYNSN